MTYEAEWTITTSGSDRTGVASIPYLCTLLQETATMHADSLGWGYDVLESEGLQWVLSRQWIRIQRYPGWKDRVVVATWPTGRKGLTWTRDYRVMDAAGAEMVRATSLWFVMDRRSRRPRPAPFGDGMSFDDVERVRSEPLKTIEVPDGVREALELRAGFHDIDVHDHVNNVQYVRWMLDAADRGVHDGTRPAELEINFMAEGFEGDVLAVATAETPGQSFHSLRRPSDDVELCRLSCRWETLTGGV